jgi:hypothetical protein
MVLKYKMTAEKRFLEITHSESKKSDALIDRA